MINTLVSVSQDDTYCYITDSHNFIIRFKNKKFLRVDFQWSGIYTREQWKVLAEIDRLITQIEESYEN